MKKESNEFLSSRMEDLVKKAEKKGISAGDFLSSEEQAQAFATLNRLKKEFSFDYRFEGGVKGAERAVPLLWAPYCQEESQAATAADIRLLAIRSKSGQALTHSAVLGSVLALGIERKAVGDIFPYENITVIAVKESVANYIKEQLLRVGKDTVTVSDHTLSDDFEIIRKTERILLSVSSLRLDCVVGAICHMSREDASEYISSGMVSVNHRQILKCDFKLSVENTLSLRGYGRFRLSDTEGNTKSGRLRLVVEKSV